MLNLIFNLFKKTPTPTTVTEKRRTPRQLTNQVLSWLALNCGVGAEIVWVFPDGTEVFFSKDVDQVVFLVFEGRVWYGLEMYEAIEVHFASIA